MADEEVEAGEDAAGGDKPAGKKGGMIGAVLGLLAVLVVGVGLGLYVAQLVAPQKKTKLLLRKKKFKASPVKSCGKILVKSCLKTSL